MNCPKCQSEDQNGKYCENCGHQLKEPCPECGEWETIGRPVCLTKIENAQDALDEVLERANNSSYFRKFLLLIFFVPLIISVPLIYCFETSRYLLAATVFFSCILLIYIVVYRILLVDVKKRKEAVENFYKTHPDYKEILKKAGEL